MTKLDQAMRLYEEYRDLKAQEKELLERLAANKEARRSVLGKKPRLDLENGWELAWIEQPATTYTVKRDAHRYVAIKQIRKQDPIMPVAQVQDEMMEAIEESNSASAQRKGTM